MIEHRGFPRSQEAEEDAEAEFVLFQTTRLDASLDG